MQQQNLLSASSTPAQDGGIDLATLPDFEWEYRKLEDLVTGGTADPVEQLVFLVATLAAQSARDAGELRRMLDQQKSLAGVVYVTARFPMDYRRHFLYAGRLYDLLMDTLPR
jgi:hypothetical protein